MNVALSATIQQNPHSKFDDLFVDYIIQRLDFLDHSDPNNLMNSLGPNLTPAECRQSEELNNQMMNCLR